MWTMKATVASRSRPARRPTSSINSTLESSRASVTFMTLWIVGLSTDTGGPINLKLTILRSHETPRCNPFRNGYRELILRSVGSGQAGGPGGKRPSLPLPDQLALHAVGQGDLRLQALGPALQA